MKAFKTALLAGVGVLALANSSFALTASGGSISFTSPTDYYTQIGNLSLFNSAAGTLTGVTFTAGYGFNSTISVSATTTSTGNVSTESAANFQTSNSAIQQVLNALINTAPNAIIGSTQLTPTAYDYTGPKAIYNVGPGVTNTYQSNVATTSATYTATPSELSAFIASGNGPTTFDIYGQTLTGLNLTSTGGNATATQQTTAMQNISVMYTYNAAVVVPPTNVPEPASLALLGAGLIGAGLIRRKSV